MTIRPRRLPWWVPLQPPDDTLATLLRVEARIVVVERELSALKQAVEALTHRYRERNPEN